MVGGRLRKDYCSNISYFDKQGGNPLVVKVIVYGYI